MSKFILIPDSFKGTLSATEICKTMESAIADLQPSATILSIPVADGGEGTVDAFLQAMGGEKVTVAVHGPYQEDITSFYGRLPDGTAVIEMAAAAGLPMVGDKRNAEATTTYGVGELMKHALTHGAKKIILGLGGSATNDGGCGMAAALGIRFMDSRGFSFVPVGKTLKDIVKIDTSQRDPLLRNCRVVVMCDIDNHLCGEQGASAVFGPQKGADAAMVQRLDAGLFHMSEVIRRDLGKDILTLSGAGAAGGMGGGAVAYVDGMLQMGIDTVLEAVHFEALVQDADLILTGEGRLDNQSLRGKVVVGVARKAHGKPVIAIVGCVDDDVHGAYQEGVTAVFSINRKPLPYEQAILRTKENIFTTTQDVLRCFQAGKQ